jgi:hypothetical protein
VATEVHGADRLATDLRDYAASLGSVPPAQVGRIMLDAAKARAPVVTGMLRASGVWNGAVTFTVPYAPPIHWGWRARNIRPNPFALAGIEASERVWSAAYENELQADLDKIEGA